MPDLTAGDVLLTGAAGFVGSRLWPALNAVGLRVRCVSRDAERAAHRWPERQWVQADLADPADLTRALAGCRVAYYLVHGLAERQRDFRSHEVALARAFSDAAARAGLERIIYLGGVAPLGAPSEHLRSRLEVGAALRAGRVPTIELRAGMVVGTGSTSWLIVRDLTARLPAMVLPRWMQTRSQPVAVDDVVVALLGARRVPLQASGWYDLPGPEILSGREILERTAEALGLRRPFIIAVPFLSPALSSHWVRLVTRANWPVARELVLGLAHDLLAQDARYWGLIGHEQLLPFREAARRALTEDRAESRMNGFEWVVESAVYHLAKADHGTQGSTVATEGVHSVQAVELPMEATSFEHWGQPGTLRQLLDAYFRVAELSSGGVMRVRWAGDAPTVALRWLGLPLIVMGAPTTVCDSVRRAISVPVTGGLVAAHGGSARLAIVLARHGTNVRLSVELSGYRPRAAHIWPVPWIYWLQAGLHARVGQRFVRRCARAWRRAS
ncbi:MAG TPA: NAD-dependent epimerase/dehydratase family protein [Chloroflexota bacterium]|nr:NAD-dependent epimerase/dehydratase family protein [Chloroflexota bacterium]